jgi:MoaA/NifB/PqqE/SkfB family radical SAM enzyme
MIRLLFRKETRYNLIVINIFCYIIYIRKVNGATAAIAAGLDVIVNTNKMTSAQDFSNVDYVAKDIDYDQIVARFLFVKYRTNHQISNA